MQVIVTLRFLLNEKITGWSIKSLNVNSGTNIIANIFVHTFEPNHHKTYFAHIAKYSYPVVITAINSLLYTNQ